MTMLMWNVRGANQRHKQKELAKYIKDKHITLAGFVKTRVKQHKASVIAPKIAHNWELVHNYDQAANGRIWIMFDTNTWQVDTVVKDAQFIHCNVTSTNVNCAMIVTYGYNSVDLRKGLWHKLKILAQSINQPWFIWGDFNAIKTTQDRISRQEVTLADIQDFAEFCLDTMTTDIPWRGDYFTWSNGQTGVERVISRIDRALGNNEWMMKFGHLTVEVGDPFISDHSPLSLKFEQRKSVKIPFRFLNVWAEDEAFQSIVTKGWQGRQHQCKLVTIWNRMKEMKANFKSLNNRSSEMQQGKLTKQEGR
ncbi:PREDICTED: uncharacterized protein LOC109243167 [Nicotiana attenuata]|uniref:uncharacterized protein LOC109243167 n=1 Tax=Nicotiana attenuata TaxID=49451 RepID=UPI0009057CA9|nr:PREDICTED: uncharacterized protein LOC109243167 [Nicotiana attenuata]